MLSTFFISNTSADPGKKEWKVWHKECPVYTSTEITDQEPVKTLFKDETIQGLKYFTIGEDSAEWILFRLDGKTHYAPFAYLTHIPKENMITGNLPMGKENVDRWNGLPHDYEPDDLVTIPGRYCYTKREYRVRKPVLAPLTEMLDSARKENLSIWVVSSYRTASWQKRKFLQKIEKEGYGQRVSAKPGHSEHQLGTTVDLTGSDPKLVLEQGFGDTKEGIWLKENCNKFGFAISYTEHNHHETGYIPEPWHFRYIGTEN